VVASLKKFGPFKCGLRNVEYGTLNTVQRGKLRAMAPYLSPLKIKELVYNDFKKYHKQATYLDLSGIQEGKVHEIQTNHSQS